MCWQIYPIISQLQFDECTYTASNAVPAQRTGWQSTFALHTSTTRSRRTPLARSHPARLLEIVTPLDPFLRSSTASAFGIGTRRELLNGDHAAFPECTAVRLWTIGRTIFQLVRIAFLRSFSSTRALLATQTTQADLCPPLCHLRRCRLQTRLCLRHRLWPLFLPFQLRPHLPLPPLPSALRQATSPSTLLPPHPRLILWLLSRLFPRTSPASFFANGLLGTSPPRLKRAKPGHSSCRRRSRCGNRRSSRTERWLSR